MTQSRFLLAALVAAALSAPAFSQILYVDGALSTGAGDGSSWDNAFQGEGGLQDALAAVAAGEQIWVARGTYRPDSVGNRNASFILQNDVEIYGGLEPGATSLDSRPLIGEPLWSLTASSLTGDLAGDDDPTNLSTMSDNSYHLVRTGGTNASAVLDGFQISGGNANGGGGNNDRGGGVLCLGSDSPTFRNCSFTGNRCTFGGGAGYVNGRPTFLSCHFIANRGGSFGGAFDIAGGNNILFDRCVFRGNQASRAGALEIFSSNNIRVVNSLFVENIATGGSGGGAFWVGNGNITDIVNCTITGNQATNQAQGGIREQGANARVTNCIIWNNSGSGGAQASVNQVSPAADVNYSIVQGGFTGGTGILDADPEFVGPAAFVYSVSPTSPAIDAGDNGVFTGALSDIGADFFGARRFFDSLSIPDTGAGNAPIVDMGISEFTTNIGIVYCTNTIANSTGNRARIDGTGSVGLAANNLTLVASGMPLNAFGYFLVSRSSGFVGLAGGSQGNLCLGGDIGRYVAPAQIGNTGATGSFELTIDLNAMPQPTGFVSSAVGDVWHFQTWHRDSFLGFPTSNFSDGLRIQVGS